MRGQHVSKPIEQIVLEAERLVKIGVKEIMLIAQELTYYGLDLYKERRLADLLNALADVKGLEWIRLHYAYPTKFPMEILDVMRERDNICNYLDIPLQHIADPMLKAMKRQITRKEIVDLIAGIREKVPGIALRTTLITGFPAKRWKTWRMLNASWKKYASTVWACSLTVTRKTRPPTRWKIIFQLKRKSVAHRISWKRSRRSPWRKPGDGWQSLQSNSG